VESVEGLTVRAMTDGDMAAMVEIDKRIVGKERVVSWPQKVSSHFKTHYPPLSFVAELDGRVVGFIMGVIMGAEYALPLSGWINIIGVDPDYQRRGVASMLLNSFIEACHQRGIKCRLMVRQKDERLKRLLLSRGFQQGDLVDFVKGFGQ
jgi:ribosomal protein S18 acetylase RimI-like enzyme